MAKVSLRLDVIGSEANLSHMSLGAVHCRRLTRAGSLVEGG
jgi:hypothetical protein